MSRAGEQNAWNLCINVAEMRRPPVDGLLAGR